MNPKNIQLMEKFPTLYMCACGGFGLSLGGFVDLWFRIIEERVIGLYYELKDGLMSYLMAFW